MKIFLKIIVAFPLIFLFGCGVDEQSKMQIVQSKFPECEVHCIPIRKNPDILFLVRKQDGTVIFVNCGNITNSEITRQYVVFQPNKITDK